MDNNSARGGILKGRSSSPTMDDLVKALYAAEVLSPAFWWVERVPSKSNAADEPSRAVGREAADLWKAIFRDHFSCQINGHMAHQGGIQQNTRYLKGGMETEPRELAMSSP